ncbi:hypothetical protein DL98DRAFT_131781 [Cadophora sp. DSE1049]|nr:hypothetical protein DL98DRAFT_131781 [Cadophora sp. DSE1049]
MLDRSVACTRTARPTSYRLPSFEVSSLMLSFLLLIHILIVQETFLNCFDLDKSTHSSCLFYCSSC